MADPQTTLIGPEDPAPFSVFNPDGTAKVLFVSDHSGRAIPKHMQQLGLADWVMDKHVAWDIGSGDVARHLAEHFDATLISANYSRLVIDTNRPPQDPTLCIPLSEGIAIPGNMDLTDTDIANRRAAFFDPYHKAIDTQLDSLTERGFTPAIIAIHSCTPVFDQIVRPWHVGILWDKDPRIAVPLLAHFDATPEVCVGDNEPYSGKDPHDYTMDHHGEGRRLPHVSIELRQDLIDTPEGARHWAGVLADALDSILADETLYTLLP